MNPDPTKILTTPRALIRPNPYTGVNNLRKMDHNKGLKNSGIGKRGGGLNSGKTGGNK